MRRNEVPILTSLAATLWFASLAKGAHDLWAVSILDGWLSLVTMAFLWQCRQLQKPLFLPLGFYFLSVFFAFLQSSRSSFDMNNTRLELWIWFFCGIAFFLFVNIFRDPAQRVRLLKFGGLVILPLTGIALAQYINQRPLPHSHWSAESTFTNSSVLAGFSLSWIFIFWHFRQKGPLYRWLLGGCVVLLCLARSWWAFASLFAGFLFYYKEPLRMLWLTKRKTSIGVSWVVALLLLLVSGYKLLLSENYLYRATDRLGWWMAGIRMLMEYPWVGVGLGSYGTAFPFFKTYVLQNTLYAHNFPIQLLSETGILGFAGVLLLAFAYARVLFVAKTISSEFMAYRATVLAILVFSLTTIYLEYCIGKLMLLMGMALTLSSVPMRGHSLSKNVFFSTAMGLVLLAPSWYLPFHASQFHVAGVQYEKEGNLELAVHSFQKAITLNPYQDESCSALARIHRYRYEEFHSLLDLSSSMLWSHNAFDLRKTPALHRETAG